MSKIDTPKKPAQQDWLPAYLVYRLRLAGLSFRRLSRQHGYCASSAQMATRIPWPKMERIVADALGVQPQEIWPSRYHADGTPKSGRGERGIGRRRSKRDGKQDHTYTTDARNVEVKGAA